MNKPTYGSKLLACIAIAVIGAAAGFGYFKQSAALSESQAKPAVKIGGTVLNARTDDIILGDANAPVTIVEYMSISCTHCAHFHLSVLPEIEKNFIAAGKTKLVIRHFPLNEPAIKGSVVVECAGQNNLERKNFLKVLLEMQSKWAFGEDFLKNLKQIALVGGIDSAAFESCLADKSLETRILASRKEGEEALKVDATPSFFINGAKYEGDRDYTGFKKAIEAALASQK